MIPNGFPKHLVDFLVTNKLPKYQQGYRFSHCQKTVRQWDDQKVVKRTFLRARIPSWR